MDRILEHIERLNQLKENALVVTDPIAKELRNSQVLMHPLIVRRLEALAVCLDWEPVHGRSFVRTKHHFCHRDSFLLDKHTDNFVLSGFYQALDESPAAYIAPKLSTKVRVKGLTMRQHWVSRLRAARLIQGRTPEFKSVLHFGTGPLWGTYLFETERMRLGLDFLRDLYRIAVAAASAGLVDHWMVRQFREKWDRPSRLTMHTKYYFTRGDHRAYFVDKSENRSLAGATLQALLLPNGSRRFKLLSEGVLPAIGRNRLDWSNTIPSGHSAMMTLGDVSSFSGSNVNSWGVALLQTMLLLSEGYEHLNTPTVAFIEDEPFEFRAAEVLAVYLYEAVFATYTIQNYAGRFYALGGYLGVNANMALTTLSFALQAEWHILEVVKYGVKCKVQLGGDDFAVLEVAPIYRWASVADSFLYYTRRYMGPLKDPSRVDISLFPQGRFRMEGLFCKRPVDVILSQRSHGRSCTILSRSCIPVLSALFAEWPKTKYEREKTLNEFVNTVWSESQHTTHLGADVSLALELLSHIHHIPPPATIRKCAPTEVGSHANWSCVEGAWMSDAVLEAIDRIEPVYDSQGFAYLTTVAHRLRWLQAVPYRVEFIRAFNGFKEVHVAVTHKEFKSLLGRLPRVNVWLPKSDDYIPWLSNVKELYDEIRQIL